MKPKIITLIVLLICAIAGCFYLFPYAQLMVSPFSWNEADINKDGHVSMIEADYFGNYGKRQYVENGKSCMEYYALKDGLPLKKECK